VVLKNLLRQITFRLLSVTIEQNRIVVTNHNKSARSTGALHQSQDCRPGAIFRHDAGVRRRHAGTPGQTAWVPLRGFVESANVNVVEMVGLITSQRA
jgi:flagellar basal body rod protein FlgG